MRFILCAWSFTLSILCMCHHYCANHRKKTHINMIKRKKQTKRNGQNEKRALQWLADYPVKSMDMSIWNMCLRPKCKKYIMIHSISEHKISLTEYNFSSCMDLFGLSYDCSVYFGCSCCRYWSHPCSRRFDISSLAHIQAEVLLDTLDQCSN